MSAKKIGRYYFRSLTKDFAYGIIICLSFFVLVELTLRLTGVRPAAVSDDPFVGFYGLTPLYDVQDGVATTSPCKLPMFNDVRLTVKKPPRTVRIFCFGGSTTYGQPYDGRSAFPRWLQDLLQASCPDTHFEVINSGGISYASYRIVPLIQETLAYEPDLMVVYCGHNEFLERRTYSGILAQGRLFVTLRSYAEKLSLHEALSRLWKPVIAVMNRAFQPTDSCVDFENELGADHTTDLDTKGRWLMDGEATEIMANHEGMSIYHRDQEFSKHVSLHFEYNLRKMIALCRSSGVPVILVDPPSNLKDFSPFKSEYSPYLSEADKVQLTDRLKSARKTVEAKRWQEALYMLDEIITRDPLYAESQYWKGKALLGLGRNAAALSCFVQAKDLDVCPLRCTTALQERITRVAKDEGAILIPFREIVLKRCSKTSDRTGIPGDESFLDHVHPTMDLHQVAAGLIFDAMVDKAMVRPARKLTEIERINLFSDGMRSFDPGFFVDGRINLAWVLHWYKKGSEARSVLRRVAEEQRDASLYEQIGHWLMEDGYFSEAVQEYKTAVRLSHQDPRKELSLARAYLESGRDQEAMAIFKRLTDADKSIPEAYADLALAKLRSNEIDKALEVVRTGLSKHPDASVLMMPHGLALAAQGKGDEAICCLEKALKSDPDDLEAMYELARLHARLGNTFDSLRYLRYATRKGFCEYEELNQDQAFDSVRRLPQYQSIVAEMKRWEGR